MVVLRYGKGIFLYSDMYKSKVSPTDYLLMEYIPETQSGCQLNKLPLTRCKIKQIPSFFSSKWVPFSHIESPLKT